MVLLGSGMWWNCLEEERKFNRDLVDMEMIQSWSCGSTRDSAQKIRGSTGRRRVKEMDVIRSW